MKNVIQNGLVSKIKRLSHRIVVDGSACYPILVMFFLSGWVPIASARPQKTVVDVDSKSQLFIDQELVYDAKGVSFTLHPGRKVSDRPLVKVDQPCEGSHVQMYGSVLYDSDEKLFKMWYLATASDFFSRETTFYATSRGPYCIRPCYPGIWPGVHRGSGGRPAVWHAAPAVDQ